MTTATGDGLRVSAPVDLRGRFDGCALQVEEAKPSGTRRSMVIPRFEASESFADVGTALKVAEAIEEEPALCNGDLSPLLGWGADGRTVEIEVVWADSPRVDRLRRLYGPVTVVSKLSPL